MANRTYGRSYTRSTTPRKYTKEQLQELALFYCSQRETSRSRLRQYLLRKLPRNNEDLSLVEAIDAIIEKCEKLKIIDHERYAGIVTREYGRRGKGKRYVQQKLKERGLDEEIKKIEFPAEEEYERAFQSSLKLLQRSNIKKLTVPYEIKQKLLQRLVASGFELILAKKAIEAALEETKNER